MKLFSFQIDLPGNHSRTFIFDNQDKAQNRLSEFLDSDPRFNPSQLSETSVENEPVIVDKNNKYVEYELDSLVYVGHRKGYKGGTETDEDWYASPGFEAQVKKTLDKLLNDPSTTQPQPKKETSFPRIIFR